MINTGKSKQKDLANSWTKRNNTFTIKKSIVNFTIDFIKKKSDSGEQETVMSMLLGPRAGEQFDVDIGCSFAFRR